MGEVVVLKPIKTEPEPLPPDFPDSWEEWEIYSPEDDDGLGFWDRLRHLWHLFFRA